MPCVELGLCAHRSDASEVGDEVVVVGEAIGLGGAYAEKSARSWEAREGVCAMAGSFLNNLPPVVILSSKM